MHAIFEGLGAGYTFNDKQCMLHDNEGKEIRWRVRKEPSAIPWDGPGAAFSGELPPIVQQAPDAHNRHLVL